MKVLSCLALLASVSAVRISTQTQRLLTQARELLELENQTQLQLQAELEAQWFIRGLTKSQEEELNNWKDAALDSDEGMTRENYINEAHAFCRKYNLECSEARIERVWDRIFARDDEDGDGRITAQDIKNRLSRS